MLGNMIQLFTTWFQLYYFLDLLLIHFIKSKYIAMSNAYISANTCITHDTTLNVSISLNKIVFVQNNSNVCVFSFKKV